MLSSSPPSQSLSLPCLALALVALTLLHLHLAAAYPTGSGTCDADETAISSMPGATFASSNGGWTMMLDPATADTTITSATSAASASTSTSSSTNPFATGAGAAAIGSDITSTVTNSSLFGSLPSGVQSTINTNADSIVASIGGTQPHLFGLNAVASPASGAAPAAAMAAPTAPVAGSATVGGQPAAGSGVTSPVSPSAGGLTLGGSPSAPAGPSSNALPSVAASLAAPGSLSATTAPATTAAAASSFSSQYYTPGQTNVIEFVNTDATQSFTGFLLYFTTPDGSRIGTFTPQSDQHLMSTCTPATSTLTHSTSDVRPSGYKVFYNAPTLSQYSGVLEGHAVLMSASRVATLLHMNYTALPSSATDSAILTTTAPVTTSNTPPPSQVVVATDSPDGSSASTNSSKTANSAAVSLLEYTSGMIASLLLALPSIVVMLG